MIETVLALHIIGGIITGFVGGASLVAIGLNKANTFRTASIAMAVLAGYEMLSGTLLSIISDGISARSMCARVALYLMFVAFVQIQLFIRMRREAVIFPKHATSGVAGTAVVFLSALVLGF